MKEYIDQLIDEIEMKQDEFSNKIENLENNQFAKRQVEIYKDKLNILNKVKDYLIKLFNEE